MLWWLLCLHSECVSREERANHQPNPDNSDGSHYAKVSWQHLA